MLGLLTFLDFHGDLGDGQEECQIIDAFFWKGVLQKVNISRPQEERKKDLLDWTTLRNTQTLLPRREAKGPEEKKKPRRRMELMNDEIHQHGSEMIPIPTPGEEYTSSKTLAYPYKFFSTSES
ncbi:unnamed protein product [Darwinula stevensoni]|uniref:Uncharacterized protein n=1 Tax=Darwinula stevensoni TaxID=69355 RepID=A0A7R9ABE2_9CRUS|nr:unnamed protein product [Darwinula stevensoni]CAG0899192.1 unnamed protein product [Darwinula stevensoni]